jgi:hypothetical protein
VVRARTRQTTGEDIVRRDIRLGSVSWLSGMPTPLCFAGRGEPLEPAWVVRAYMLLKATSNPTPPTHLADFPRFQARRQFRALSYCECRVDLDDRTHEVTAIEVQGAVQDPGWTPPFRLGEFAPAQVPALFADPDLRDTTWYAGEASGLSLIAAGTRHKNSAIDEVPADERVLANALLKFRAGPHPDAVAVRLGWPGHAPWLWHEWVLTYAAGRFKLYTRGSRFPSHAWYVDGRQVANMPGIADATFPPVEEPWRPGRINVLRLALYPTVLSRGAPAGDPQAPNDPEEQQRAGPVDKHPHTVPGWRATTILTL